MKNFKLSIAILVAAFLSACGGGGGGSSTPTSITIPSSTPVVVSSSSSSSIVVSSSSVVSSVTPIPVQATSYLNAKNINTPAINFDNFYHSEFWLNGQILVQGEAITPSAGFADFEQNGTFDFVAATGMSNTSAIGSDGFPVAAQPAGRFLIIKRTGTKLSDITATLIPGDKTACIHPRKMVIADFNNDGKPDVFLACHGWDIPTTPGEYSRILLSNKNGTYTNSTVPDTVAGFTHGASAADIDNDGNIDLVLVDTKYGPAVDFIHQTPVRILFGRGDGTFITDTTRISIDASPTGLHSNQFYSAELIDLNNDGKVDLVVGGNETSAVPLVGQVPTYIFTNSGGAFLNTPATLPIVDGTSPLDFVKNGNKLYVLRIASPSPAHFQSVIQEVNLDTNASTVVSTGPNDVFVCFLRVITGHLTSLNDQDLIDYLLN